MKDRRLHAYYYAFDSTKCEPVDKILGAVACAGKAYHSTECWGDQTPAYDDHTGSHPIGWIQNAANEAAAIRAK